MTRRMTREERRRIVWGPLGLWGVLMLLLGATLAYAYLPGGPGKLGVSLSIGVMKALVIALFFMQLSRAPGLVRMAALFGVIWATFLYLFAFSDYLTR